MVLRLRDMTGHHLAEAQALLGTVPTMRQQGQHTSSRLGSLEFTSRYVSLGSNVKHCFFPACLTAFLTMAGRWKMPRYLRPWCCYQWLTIQLPKPCSIMIWHLPRVHGASQLLLAPAFRMLRCIQLCPGPDDEETAFVTISAFHFETGGEHQISENNNE